MARGGTTELTPAPASAKPRRLESTTPAIDRAFVLGAGLGTRLKRLTETRPKPLIPVVGRPLITYAFDHLISAGVRELVVNTHHRAEVYSAIFPESVYRGVSIAFRHEPVLLETGGGIKNVEALLGDAPFIVYNGDILATLSLGPAIAHHLATGNEVTLLLRSRGGPLHVAFDPDSGRILDIGNRLGRATGNHLFTGIYIVQPAFFRRLKLEIASVIPTFVQMIAENAPFGGFLADDGDWWDLGTREQYLDVHRALRAADPHACWVHPTARIANDARITGATSIGADAEIGSGAEINDSVLWDGARIAIGSVLTRCIVTGGQITAGIHTNSDL